MIILLNYIFIKKKQKKNGQQWHTFCNTEESKHIPRSYKNINADQKPLLTLQFYLLSWIFLQCLFKSCL